MVSKENREKHEQRRKHEKRRARARAALRERIRNFVECPDAANGALDEYTRMTSQCEAAAMVVAGLPAADAARVLVHAAGAVEEK
ncbi:MAG: hypothetical protein OXN16_05205, partial [Gammaproteobacteria bacterium]|nr:hypothetical protein [Gammaproteobacteria bacterium]